MWEAGFTVGLVGGKLKVRPRSWCVEVGEPQPALTTEQTEAITAHIRELAAICREREREDAAVGRFLATQTGRRYLNGLFSTPFHQAADDFVQVEMGHPGRQPVVSVVGLQQHWDDIRRSIIAHNSAVDRMHELEANKREERMVKKEAERAKRRGKMKKRCQATLGGIVTVEHQLPETTHD